jgi:putative transposase
MKNVVKLDNYCCPDELKEAIDQFAQYYNYQRYQESPENLTPAERYYGRQEDIFKTASANQTKNHTTPQIGIFSEKMIAVINPFP